MSNISSNSLFHFTPKLEYLESILNNNFSPRFCLEIISGSSKLDFIDRELAIPMTCFCDIPLSLVKNHTKVYGKYGIGLTKEWAIRNKIAPLLYYYKDSPNFDAILKIAEMINKIPDDKRDLEIVLDAFKLGIYSKAYEGKFYRNGKYLKKKVKFYDEREWRYIPDLEKVINSNINPTLKKDEFLDTTILETANRNISKFKLNFEPKDIKYILIKNEKEILPVVDKLKKSKRKYSYEDVQVLTTRIITYEQLKEDF